MKASLKNQLFKAVGVDTNKDSTRLTQAPTIFKKDKGTFAVVKAFALIQADLIYMRKDKRGYEYILSVVDTASRHFDAIPLKGRTSLDVIEGFEQVWKNKNIDRSQVKALLTDPGSEFKNAEFKDYINGFGIALRHSMTARKSQTGLVEYYNHLITRTLGVKMTSDEIDTQEHVDDWADALPKIVKVLNDKEQIQTPKLADFFKPVRATNEEIKHRLEIGTVVHVRLQQPKHHLTGEKLNGGFRNGDVRFESAVTDIVNVLLIPNQPIRYMVRKYNNVSFMRKELLLASGERSSGYTRPAEPQPEAPVPLPETGPRTRAMVKRSI